MRNASYSLNYSWAKSLFAQKDYATADVRVDAALAVARSEEASALKRQIAAVKTKADASVSFDAALQDIDRLISADELVSAHRRIEILWQRRPRTRPSWRSLDDRRQTITGKLKDVYDKGVQAYRDEDFKTAIELLQTVVGVQVDYEQAGDYLDKARSKQKVLDQVQSGRTDAIHGKIEDRIPRRRGRLFGPHPSLVHPSLRQPGPRRVQPAQAR